MSSLAPPLSGDAIAVDVPPPFEREVGELWRRVGAFLIDEVILAIVGSLLALPFFAVFSRMGSWGLLFGFSFALAYFGILNSSIGNGQTVGKRWMDLQVVDKQGKTIPLDKSLIRYAVFAVPYYASDVVLPVTKTLWVFSWMVLPALSAVSFATFYLVFFNRNTRQGVHDLAVGSYVVYSDLPNPVKTEPIWKMHWIILASLLLTFALGGRALNRRLMGWGPFPQMVEDVQLIENMDGAQRVEAVYMSSDFKDDDGEKTLVITVRWSGKAEAEEAFADRVAKTILQADPKVQKYKALKVVMVRGYNIGIARSTSSHSFQHTPKEWNTQLLGNEQNKIR